MTERTIGKSVGYNRWFTVLLVVLAGKSIWNAVLQRDGVNESHPDLFPLLVGILFASLALFTLISPCLRRDKDEVCIRVGLLPAWRRVRVENIRSVSVGLLRVKVETVDQGTVSIWLPNMPSSSREKILEFLGVGLSDPA